MGQYWYVVNLDKKECVHPHKLGTGLKLWEQLANHPGTGAALIVLCAAMPQGRGGGDFDLEENWHGPQRKKAMRAGTIDGCTPAKMPRGYKACAARTIGRWAGDRIALVGDYAKDSDLAPEHNASTIYNRCCEDYDVVYNDDPKGALYKRGEGNGEHAGKYAHKTNIKPGEFKDISRDVARVIEHELGGKFKGGDGWRTWEKG